MRCCNCRSQITRSWWSVNVNDSGFSCGNTYTLIACTNDCINHAIDTVKQGHMTQTAESVIKQLLANQRNETIRTEDPFECNV